MTPPTPTPGPCAIPLTTDRKKERTPVAAEPRFWWDDHGERITNLEKQLGALTSVVEKSCKDLRVNYDSHGK